MGFGGGGLRFLWGGAAIVVGGLFNVTRRIQEQWGTLRVGVFVWVGRPVLREFWGLIVLVMLFVQSCGWSADLFLTVVRRVC